MIKLIVGLGNPGRQYEKTRHNAGFLFLDDLLASTGGSWQLDGKFQAFVAESAIAYQKVLFLKPETFMNRSGQSVGKAVRYYKIQPDEILVVHDELDFAVGVVKLKKGGGHAGHNGLRDIIAHLGSNDFYRLRIGIGRPAAGKVVADYVLSEPAKAEWPLLEDSFALAKPYIGQIVSGDIAAAMNKLNT
ncbi:aminoacyl-tRNA hydrolase [Methylovulum psychrotolerans]|uniref:Peptidyl-tRNA hydrolase n=1 Tax=Methylovulum psychrotolerans TaxID=1704499 RepID=A0A1Z4C3N4_9GAMM|nr:aminoacyl-tRNA hydrolase [Methylovulum psychrotolerans]ASF48142.1 aminoacyl-tRNA hydrolase [Methylovulum psychrotolerans]POZ53684.1 aminoacyl-tRNA hydrolase [Methylovulum psychrotolerans]